MFFHLINGTSEEKHPCTRTEERFALLTTDLCIQLRETLIVYGLLGSKLTTPDTPQMKTPDAVPNHAPQNRSPVMAGAA